jgi:hypothetical protein
LYGQIGVLHGDSAQANESGGVAMTNIGDVIVQEFRNFEAIFGFGPVAEHHRNGAEDLNIYVVVTTFFDALFGIPAVAFNFAEEGIVHHHSRATRFVVFQVHEFAVPKLFFPAG